MYILSLYKKWVRWVPLIYSITADIFRNIYAAFKVQIYMCHLTKLVLLIIICKSVTLWIPDCNFKVTLLAKKIDIEQNDILPWCAY